MKKMIVSLFRDEEGQGMTEYILILALIAVACIAVFKAFGDEIKGFVEGLTSDIGGARE